MLTREEGRLYLLLAARSSKSQPKIGAFTIRFRVGASGSLKVLSDSPNVGERKRLLRDSDARHLSPFHERPLTENSEVNRARQMPPKSKQILHPIVNREKALRVTR